MSPRSVVSLAEQQACLAPPTSDARKYMQGYLILRNTDGISTESRVRPMEAIPALLKWKR